jgi:hypothetical protein
MKMKIYNLERTTLFWNSLHHVHSKQNTGRPNNLKVFWILEQEHLRT